MLYQLLSGWHVIYTKADGPNRIDALLCAGAAVWAITLMPLLFRNTGGTQGTPVVIYATLGALFWSWMFCAICPKRSSISFARISASYPRVRRWYSCMLAGSKLCSSSASSRSCAPGRS